MTMPFLVTGALCGSLSSSSCVSQLFLLGFDESPLIFVASLFFPIFLPIPFLPGKSVAVTPEPLAPLFMSSSFCCFHDHSSNSLGLYLNPGIVPPLYFYLQYTYAVCYWSWQTLLTGMPWEHVSS